MGENSYPDIATHWQNYILRQVTCNALSMMSKTVINPG